MANLQGTAGSDSILGGIEDDLIEGGAGNDTLNGGPGNDTVNGQDGADRLIWGENPNANNEHDHYIGGDYGEDFNANNYAGYFGGDTLSLSGAGGFHIDFSTTENGTAQDAYGNTLTFEGIERLWGSAGNDTIDASGAQWNDVHGDVGHHGMSIHSGDGHDSIIGSAFNDAIDGGAGNDTIYGGEGNDLIESSAGDDLVYGGNGQDGIRWGVPGTNALLGHDTYYGGENPNNEWEVDTLNAWHEDEDGHGVHLTFTGAESGFGTDFSGNSTLEFYEFESIRTGGGADTIDASGAVTNGWQGILVSTNWGDDFITGSNASDQIEAGEGADTIEGGAGDDMIALSYGIYDAVSPVDQEQDVMVLRDGFGTDTVKGFSIGNGMRDPEGRLAAVDRLDVGNLHDANGNPIDLNDVTVGSITINGVNHAKLFFPNGEALILHSVNPDDLTRAKLHEMGIPCFCAGTKLRTQNGDVAVEDLQVGDLVWTLDHGYQPVRWLGHRALDSIDLAAAPKLRPIRIQAGALGACVPSADLMVSPQHRVLVRSSIARRMFGSDEVLVSAKHLLEMDGVAQLDVQGVEYFHVLFDSHEVVVSNGAETESLFTGAEALKSVGEAAREEIFTLFPELRDNGEASLAARQCIKGAKARQMAWRHRCNARPLNSAQT